jgi:hypothetical protein
MPGELSRPGDVRLPGASTQCVVQKLLHNNMLAANAGDRPATRTGAVSQLKVLQRNISCT